jgi:hypothetical protein
MSVKVGDTIRIRVKKRKKVDALVREIHTENHMLRLVTVTLDGYKTVWVKR